MIIKAKKYKSMVFCKSTDIPYIAITTDATVVGQTKAFQQLGAVMTEKMADIKRKSYRVVR